MSEFGWLEGELRAELAPVAAPPGLWARLARRRHVAPTRLLWPVIVLALLLASADLLWEFTKARGSLRQIAQPAASDLALVAAGAGQCDIYSSDPAHIRQWVKSRSGIEIEFPAHPASVRIVGAKVVSVRGTLIASVSYEAGQKAGTMLVWKNGRRTESSKHALPSAAESRGELVSWTQGENAFAAGPERDACRLCHPDGSL